MLGAKKERTKEGNAGRGGGVEERKEERLEGREYKRKRRVEERGMQRRVK